MSLYYIIAKLWATPGDYEIYLRTLSLIFCLAAYAILFRTLIKLSSVKTAVIFLAFTLSHFYLARYSVEIRGYALTIFLMSIAFASWHKYTYESASRVALIVYFLAGALSVYAHIFSSLYITVLSIAALFHFTTRKQISNWIIVNISIGICWLPMAAFILFNDKGQLAWVETPDMRALLELFYMYAGASPQAPNIVRRSLLVIFFFFGCLTVINFFISFRKNDENRILYQKAFYLLFSAIIPVLLVTIISQVKPIFSGRYFVYYVPFFFIAISIVVGKLNNKKSIPLTIVIASLLISSSAYFQKREVVPWNLIAGAMNKSCAQHKKIGATFVSANIQTAVLYYTQCPSIILPFRVSAEKYLWSASQYPERIDVPGDLDEVWIITGHTRNALDKVIYQYNSQIAAIYSNCDNWIHDGQKTDILICSK